MLTRELEGSNPPRRSNMFNVVPSMGSSDSKNNTSKSARILLFLLALSLTAKRTALDVKNTVSTIRYAQYIGVFTVTR